MQTLAAVGLPHHSFLELHGLGFLYSGFIPCPPPRASTPRILQIVVVVVVLIVVVIIVIVVVIIVIVAKVVVTKVAYIVDEFK